MNGEMATIIGTGVGVIGFVYMFFRNFKTDMNAHMNRLEQRIDTIDERMFYLSTGRSLHDAILAEKMKEKK